MKKPLNAGRSLRPSTKTFSVSARRPQDASHNAFAPQQNNSTHNDTAREILTPLQEQSGKQIRQKMLFRRYKTTQKRRNSLPKPTSQEFCKTLNSTPYPATAPWPHGKDRWHVFFLRRLSTSNRVPRDLLHIPTSCVKPFENFQTFHQLRPSKPRHLGQTRCRGKEEDSVYSPAQYIAKPSIIVFT